MLHKVDTRDYTLYFVEFTLQKVDACDCTLSFAEFGLWLVPKANPHKILKSYCVSSVVLSCLNSPFYC